MCDSHDLTGPSQWISRFTPSLPPGSRVLDLACGAGRHTRPLLSAGHHVTAVDRDLTRVEDLAADSNLRLVEADLEGDGCPWPTGDERFTCVLVTNYLWRPLFPAILAAVADGGTLLYETFAVGHEQFGKPRNPDFLLGPGELLDVVRGHLEVIAFEQGRVETPATAVVQRIWARRSRPDERRTLASIGLPLGQGTDRL